MILAAGNGRLGNQLFQLAFISRMKRPCEIVFMSDMENVEILLSKCKFFVFLKGKLRDFYRRILFPRMRRLAKDTRFFGYIAQNVEMVNGYAVHTDIINKKKGFFPLTVIENDFFQSEKLIEGFDKASLTYRNTILVRTEEILSQTPKNATKVFVHIRRGDYLSEGILGGSDMALPVSYYKRCIHWFKENLPNPFFLFLSDDMDFVVKEFSSESSAYFSHNSQYVDFILMTKCDGGIMSNSSFSWWGAYLAPKGPFFYPKNWMGFRSGLCVPIGIEPSFAMSVEV